MTHRFFLSYASSNRGKPLERFYSDLAKYVRDRLGGEIDQIAFRDRVTMQAGTEWELALFEALKTSQVLVFLQSVDYLISPNCGKELQAFRLRLDEYKREKLRTAVANADRAKAQVELQTPLFIQPVIWIPPAGNIRQPPVLLEIQRDDDAFPKTYATMGLESLAMQRDKTGYKACVAIIGERVVQAAVDQLPMLMGYSKYNEIPSAFDETVEPPAHQALPQSIPAGPTQLNCVYVAASEEEIRRHNAAVSDLSRADLSCYDRGGWYWKPFHPSEPLHVGRIIQSMIAEYPYDSLKISDNNTNLLKQLQVAAETDQIVLLIVDAWTASTLQHYQDFLKAFDTSVQFNHAVLVPWNEDDEQTQAQRDRLKAWLRLLFRNKYPGGQASTRFRSDIRSVGELRSALLSMLEMIRSEIETHCAAQLQIQGQPIAQIRTAREQPNVT